MEHTITKNFSNAGTRNEVRMRVVNQFAEENPGEGTGDSASKYIYNVETLSGNKKIYLKRPANLHSGFDFRISIEGMNFNPDGKARDYPTHDEIFEDLQLKKDSSPEKYSRLLNLIQKVYDCQDVEDNEYNGLEFNVGMPVDHIVKILKWLFIEQDIRYWNYSGRGMLLSGIPKS